MFQGEESDQYDHASSRRWMMFGAVRNIRRSRETHRSRLIRASSGDFSD